MLVWGLFSTPCRTSTARCRRCRCPAPRPRSSSTDAAVTDRIAGAFQGAASRTPASSPTHQRTRRFKDTETQLRAKDVIEQTFNPDAADPSHVVALNLLSAFAELAHLDPERAADVSRPRPARRGYFRSRSTWPGALVKRLDDHRRPAHPDARQSMRHAGITREGNTVVIDFRDAARQARPARDPDSTADLQFERDRWPTTSLVAT